jgi:hypothetical protein
MKNHVLRPLWLALGLVALILLLRVFMVPDDFGIHGRNFTYGFYRLSNVQEWKDFPVKYQGEETCAECHEENYTDHAGSKHKIIQCENCHGPAVGHPDTVEKLPIDKDKELCLRCHAYLPYKGSQRNDLPAIDPVTHKKGRKCLNCHSPHNPDLEDM